MKWRLLSWVITCTRKCEHLLLEKDWTQQCNRIMLRTNMLLQFFKKERRRSLLMFPSESLESFQRLSAKENRYQIIVHGKAVNQNDGLGIKVRSRLLFTVEEKFINILKERLPKLF